MPYVHIDPELFIEYRGVKVYHCYKDDVKANFWYTLNPSHDDIYGCVTDGQFDVRDLPQDRLAMALLGDTRVYHKFIIVSAISKGGASALQGR